MWSGKCRSFPSFLVSQTEWQETILQQIVVWHILCVRTRACSVKGRSRLILHTFFFGQGEIREKELLSIRNIKHWTINSFQEAFLPFFFVWKNIIIHLKRNSSLKLFMGFTFLLNTFLFKALQSLNRGGKNVFKSVQNNCCVIWPVFFVCCKESKVIYSGFSEDVFLILKRLVHSLIRRVGIEAQLFQTSCLRKPK